MKATMMLGLNLLIPLLGVLLAQSNAYRVAIIGGGISGTFTAKYLAQYDAHHRINDGGTRDCLLDEIVVYDVSPPPTGFSDHPTGNSPQKTPLKSSADPRPPNFQGSRVASITLEDGSLVELGASIIYEGNQLVVDMMNGDPKRLKKGKPMGTGKIEKGGTQPKPSGFGIYHGKKEWLLKPYFGNYPSFLKKILQPLHLLWRYNFDLFRLKSAVKQAVHSFDLIYDVLNDTQHEVTYFNTPSEIWQTMELGSLAAVRFHDFLDALGLYRDKSLELESADSMGGSGWDWRQWIPGMGCLRSELVTAMTLNTYNQDLNEMNGLVGLVAWVPSGGELFSIEGGNHQLMESALFQSKEIYDSSTCKSSQQRIQRHQKKITTVVASESAMELFGETQEQLGTYDVVILAAPLQQSRVQFLVQSPMGLDEAVLHEMPLGGVRENLEDELSSSDATTNEHGQHLFAASLPSSATVPYTSVVTTVVSNATLNATHFGLRDDEQWPRSILVSERGKLLEEITTLTILSIEQGLMKTFSSVELSVEKRNMIFGVGHVLEYVQAWGGDEIGKYGGATPNFAGGNNSEPLPFLLYDGAKHWGKGNLDDGPALYYVNAIESAVAAIEISAIGAKATSKLVARRLGLIRPKNEGGSHDEL